MDTKLMITKTDTALTTLWEPKNIAPAKAGEVICSFLDTATVSMGRATHYNTREEQQTAELKAHEALLGMSRDVYTVLLALPGVSDHAVQIGMKRLLSESRNGNGEFLRPEDERAVLYHLIQALPPQRMLKLVDAFRLGSEELGLKKANNARTRKIILRTLLGSPRLQLWSVKYRHKVAAALTHAWGQKMASAIREILAKPETKRTPKEKGILNAEICRYAGDEKAFKAACECVGFTFGNRDRLRLPLLKAFVGAKTDLKAGMEVKGFPMEVLEGIRSTFHKNVPREEILKGMKDNLTTGQRMTVQRQAKAAGVEVEMDVTKYDAVRLYLYAFEMGLTEAITKALDDKAKRMALGFPAHYKKVGILVDASASMAGDKTQSLRPMAVALTLRDMLKYVGDEHLITYVGGEMGQIVRPMGDTALADGLVEVLSADPMPEVVFVLSDGYENTPAGRFAEVVEQVREIGVTVPIYHLSPVFAAEATGVRELAPKAVPTMPVRAPEALGATIIRGLIEAEPVKGINALLRLALTSGPVETKALLQ